MPQLDQPCSKHFTYRQLIECGETWQSSSIDNLPLADQSWQALADLATHILDPVYEQFGNLNLTYGFCSPTLATARKKLAKAQGMLPSIYPTLDQHSGFETNRKGDIICSRGGAACDFQVPATSSQEVAIWVVKQLPFDSLILGRRAKTISVFLTLCYQISIFRVYFTLTWRYCTSCHRTAIRLTSLQPLKIKTISTQLTSC